MNDSQKKTKKLSLNKETLRNISEQTPAEGLQGPLTSPRCTESGCPTDLC